jgi:hypothetical protein
MTDAPKRHNSNSPVREGWGAWVSMGKFCPSIRIIAKMDGDDIGLVRALLGVNFTIFLKQAVTPGSLN